MQTSTLFPAVAKSTHWLWEPAHTALGLGRGCLQRQVRVALGSGPGARLPCLEDVALAALRAQLKAELLEGVDGPNEATDMSYSFTALIQEVGALASGAPGQEQGFCPLLMEPTPCPVPAHSEQTGRAPAFLAGILEVEGL